MIVCQDVTGLPVSPLLIFNSSWPAPECGAGGPDYDKYNQHCNGLVSGAPLNLRCRLSSSLPGSPGLSP